MTKQQWLVEVFKIAKSYGYTESQINVFMMDIEISYDTGDSPEICVSKVF